MAQLGVLTTEFDRPSFEETLDAVVGHGIKSVQLHLGSAVPAVPLRSALRMGLTAVGEHVTPSLIEEVHQALADHQVAVAAVDGTFNMAHPDPQRRAVGLKHLRRLFAWCPELGTSVVTLCTGSRDDIMWRRHRDNDSTEAWTELVSVMREAVAGAEEHQLVLAFEPEVSTVASSAKRARQLIDEVGSPALKVVMDPANIFGVGELAHMGEKLDEAFALLGEHIALAHAKDVDQDGEAGHLAAGRGRLDYDRYLSLLESSGFAGTVVLHQLHGLDDSEIDACFAYVLEHAPEGFLT